MTLLIMNVPMSGNIHRLTSSSHFRNDAPQLEKFVHLAAFLVEAFLAPAFLGAALVVLLAPADLGAFLVTALTTFLGAAFFT